MGAALCVTVALAGCDPGKKLDLSDLSTLLNFPSVAASQPAAPSPAAAPPDEKVAAIPPSPQLARFRDLKATEVEALVGGPDFRRVEAPAELWQYRTAECVVDLFFYGKGDDRRVVHADARSRDPARASDESCGDGGEVLKDRLRAGAG